MGAEAVDDFNQCTVVAVKVTRHVLIEQLDGQYMATSRDDFDARGFADVVAGNQCAGVLRLKGVFHPQWNTAFAQALGRAGVNRLHAKVGQLVGYVVVGTSNGYHLVGPNLSRVGTA